MNTSINEKVIAYLTLLSGLTISAVAVYYSVTGLAAIFAGATIPIIVMGVVLEVSKIIASVWLKQNWTVAPRLIKFYLCVSVALLMMITSMGIFGFLSKAHLDQNVPTANVAAQVALIDEKIKTERENVETARTELKQMGTTVDQAMTRSTDERGADKAAAIRKSQQRERAALMTTINQSQQRIVALNNERAPIAVELRKVEAEVGPIKYIAAFFYGTTDHTILEKAVTWMIILIIVVFDPLALILLIASQVSFQNLRKPASVTEELEPVVTKSNPAVLFSEIPDVLYSPIGQPFDFSKHPYLFTKGDKLTIAPQVTVVEPVVDPVVDPIVELELVPKSDLPVTEVDALEPTKKPTVFPRVKKNTATPDSNIQNEEQQDTNLVAVVPDNVNDIVVKKNHKSK